MINVFGKPIRLYTSSVSKNGTIAKYIKDLEIPSDIEIVPIQINIRKQKVAIVAIV